MINKEEKVVEEEGVEVEVVEVVLGLVPREADQAEAGMAAVSHHFSSELQLMATCLYDILLPRVPTLAF